MALPISVEAKGVLWFILFGLAKTCQYGGLLSNRLNKLVQKNDRFLHCALHTFYYICNV